MYRLAFDVSDERVGHPNGVDEVSRIGIVRDEVMIHRAAVLRRKVGDSGVFKPQSVDEPRIVESRLLILNIKFSCRHRRSERQIELRHLRPGTEQQSVVGRIDTADSQRVGDNRLLGRHRIESGEWE